MRARRGRLIAVAAAAVAASVLFIAPAASAHDFLVSSDPKDGATVSSALSTVSLDFDDVVLDENGRGALVQVTDASGRNYETDCASVDGRDVTVPVALGAPGQYRVTWQIVSADGHPVSSSIQFDYRGPKAGSGHEGPLAKCGTTVTAPAAQATDAPSSGTVPTSVVVALVIAGGVVVLAVVAVGVLLVVTRRRRAE
ncbi:copper resistance CopC family protein [Gryllotalpicola ginsengisoli]|uniref:copper resistance CopC family protein n=1 Tax=Gryllotalpicola ginsengisoli TaxID=444608 RepID=UPI0003B7176D|nr:copper resistance CopC family protein [Gryllotalpicola ginsengisoli]